MHSTCSRFSCSCSAAGTGTDQRRIHVPPSAMTQDRYMSRNGAHTGLSTNWTALTNPQNAPGLRCQAARIEPVESVTVAHDVWSQCAPLLGAGTETWTGA